MNKTVLILLVANMLPHYSILVICMVVCLSQNCLICKLGRPNAQYLSEMAVARVYNSPIGELYPEQDKARLALYRVCEQKYQNGFIYRKLKVQTSER